MTITVNPHPSAGEIATAGRAGEIATAGHAGEALQAGSGSTDTLAAAPEHAPTRLRGARGELAVLYEQVKAAGNALRRAQEPVARLRQLVSDLERAEQDVISQRSRFDGIVGQWIAAGCKGDRPDTPPQLVSAERELAEKAADARAAKAALPNHEAVVGEAAALVNELSAQRTKTHVLAALEAAKAFSAAHLPPAVAAFRSAEHRLRNVEDALVTGGHFGAAQAIRETIAAAITAPAPSPNVEAGRRFLDALMRDPSAELGASQ